MRTFLAPSVAGALLLAAGLPSAGSAEPPLPGAGAPICGISPAVDELLGCPKPEPEPPPPPGAQPQPPASPAAQLQGTAAPGRGDQAVRQVSLTPRYVDDLLLVKFAPRTPRRRQRKILEQAGVTVERRIDQIGVVAVRMPPERRDSALAQLRASPWVTRAGKSAVVEALDTNPNDAVWPDQWGLRTIGLPKAWDRTRGSSSVIVAVLDTGVDASHPDLSGAVLPGADLVNGDADASDDHGHGTAVAGIIAARTNNREGVAGVCWSCSILPLKVLDAGGFGDMSLIAAGIVRAVDAGAHVVNLSLGGPAGDQALDEAVAYAREHGALVVAAAGNDGVTTPFYPAASPGAISVAATDESDRLYSWSNSGPWAAVAAPGCNDATRRGGGYVLFCGTSSATPVVSGLVALALAAQPSATRDDVLAALEKTTNPIGAAVTHGRVDAAGALAALPSVAPSAAPVATDTLARKGSLTPRIAARTFRLAVGDGPLAATLTFSGSHALALTIRDGRGAVLSRRAGTSPLRLSRTMESGLLAVEVRGPRRTTRFALTISYERPSAAAAEAPGGGATVSSRVLLSPILQATPATPLLGPQLLSPPAVAGDGLPAAVGFGLSDRESVAASVAAAVNRLRRARGLHTVAPSSALARAAAAHAHALATAGQFTHDWSDGTPFATWMARFYPVPRRRSWSAGENLLWSQNEIDADRAVEAWLASPPHRRILLAPAWRHVGVGVVAVDEAPGLYGGRNVSIAVLDLGRAE